MTSKFISVFASVVCAFIITYIIGWFIIKLIELAGDIHGINADKPTPPPLDEDRKTLLRCGMIDPETTAEIRYIEAVRKSQEEGYYDN